MEILPGWVTDPGLVGVAALVLLIELRLKVRQLARRMDHMNGSVSRQQTQMGEQGRDISRIQGQHDAEGRR